MPRRSDQALLPKVIRNDRDHRRALKRVDELFRAKPGTPDGDELEVWLILIDRYEEETETFDLPDPITAIRFRMAQQGLTDNDLKPYLGDSKTVRDVLQKRKPLNVDMIRKLSAGLQSPAEVLIR
jgi:HTH-type transcriptional regulator/antitoxin HigA